MAVVAPQNPFIVKATGEPVESLKVLAATNNGKMVESQDSLVGANGDINAYSRKDAMRVISGLVARASAGEIARQASVTRQAALSKLAAKIRQAYLNRDAANFGMLGEEIKNEIRLTIARTGFIKRFLQERELEPGEETKIYLRKQDTLAFSLETDSMVPKSHIKAREVYLREYYISANIQIEEKEITRLRIDLLQEKLEDGTEMLQVQEDRQLKLLADAAANSLNVPLYFAALQPAVFQSLKNQVESRGVPVASCWLANNLWNDIISDGDFVNWFDPVTKHELILTGELGSMLGVALHTDAFIDSQLRVLSRGDIYFFGKPGVLGQLLVRKQLSSQELNHGLIGIPARGWYLMEIVAPAIVNANAVAHGARLS
jgi:hypothetical protein